MAYQPISKILPQYEDYAGWWIKAYEQGTTTPKSLADDSDGTTTFAKLELDSTGFPQTSGGARLEPWVDGAFDLWMFPTETEADNNDTANAIQLSDNQGNPSAFSYPATIPIWFPTVVAAQAAAFLRAGENMVVQIGERANALFDVIAATTNNGYNIIDGTASGVSLQLRDAGEPVSLDALGFNGDGVTDNSTALGALFGLGLKNFYLPEGQNYYIATRQTPSGVAGITFSGRGKFSTDNIDGFLDLDGFDDLIIRDIEMEGAETRAIWQAYSSGQRQSHRPLLEVANSDNVKIENVKSSKKSQAIKLQVCTNSTIEDCFHEGIFGAISGGVVTDPNFGYSYFINGGSDNETYNLNSKECGGTVLIGLTSERCKSCGGGCEDAHDTGFYGSSAVDSLCHGFSLNKGLANAVKFRGSRNTIQACDANDGTVAFVLSGLPLDSLVDSQGAVGYGGGIFNCKAKDSEAFIRVDRVVETADNLYMRDVVIQGNTGENFTSASSLPVELYGVKNIACKDNIVNTFAASSAYYMSGEGLGEEATGFELSGNKAINGARLFNLTNVKDSSVFNNQYENMSELVISILSNSYNNRFVGNYGDDSSKRLDIRSATVTGTHDGANNASVLTDSGASFVANGLVGRVINNTTDGSSGVITANTATTITATLSGGTDNDWDSGDGYSFFSIGKSYVHENYMFIQGNNNVQGESDSQDNLTDPNYDIATLVPERRGHIVGNGTNMYIAKGTSSTSDWVLI